MANGTTSLFSIVVTLLQHFEESLSVSIYIWFQRIAGEIKSFSADGLVSPKVLKRAGKFMLYLLRAGKKALEDGGITEEVMGELDKTRCGVLIGSAVGGMSVKSKD